MSELRRQFELPAHDREFVESLGRPWETVVEGNKRWAIVHALPVVSGYTVSEVSLALDVPPSYPDTQIDMAYFLPHLELTGGQAVAGLSNHQFDGKVWQRWSRHRTQQNPWRRDYDCIQTHLLLVEEWLERELRRAA